LLVRFSINVYPKINKKSYSTKKNMIENQEEHSLYEFSSLEDESWTTHLFYLKEKFLTIKLIKKNEEHTYIFIF